MPKEPKTDVKTLRTHTAALHAHTRELSRHTKAMTTLAAANVTLASALDKHAAAVNYLPPKGKLTPKQVKDRLGQALGVTAQSLNDKLQVTGLIRGDGAMLDWTMSKINKAFWPGVALPHLVFDQIKTLNIGKLVALILRML